MLDDEEENPEVEMVHEKDVKGLNQEWLNSVEALKTSWTSERHHCGGAGVKASCPYRGGHYSRVYGRFKALGVPILRVHTDREKSFLSKPFQRWCSDHSLYQTMTAGDDVEAEVGQIKLHLHQS